VSVEIKMDNNRLWADIQKEWKSAYPNLSARVCQEYVVQYWKEMKVRNNNKINADEVKLKLDELRAKKHSHQNKIAAMFSRPAKINTSFDSIQTAENSSKRRCHLFRI